MEAGSPGAPTRHRLLLLRHAKSSWDEPALADHDRPLSKRGRRAASALREHLLGLTEPPDVVVCSSAARTVETLQLIRPGLPTSTAVTVDETLYDADADELLDRVHRLPPTAAGVMLIGHNPGIGDLAAMLAGHGDAAARASIAEKFPTAALAVLEVDGEWTAVAPGAAHLEEYWKPR